MENGGNSRKRTRTVLALQEPSEQERSVVLKLTESSDDPLLLLEDTNEQEETELVLEKLLQLNDSVYPRILSSLDRALSLIKQLWDNHQKNIEICSVIMNILCKLLPLATQFSHDQQTLLESLIKHPSKEIKALVLKCWVGVAKNLSAEFVTQCLKETVEIMYSSSHVLRIECLNLIGQLSHRAPGQEALLLLVTEFCNDCDPRVRRESLKAILHMLQEGVAMGVPIYNKACELLRDEDESVRYIAVQVVHKLGLLLHDNTVPLSQDHSISLKLVDDAFIKICGIVNDGSLQIRCLAANLLGQFTNISSQFLLQTLDKKLMTHLQVVKSDHDRARELHGRGSWDTGQRWGGTGAPRLNLDPSDVTLMSSGSCGAFVHCTEDEYMEVRSAAITSMGQLSGLDTEFGLLSLDFLIDMINDEIQSVRLLALLTLRKVSQSIDLREDQLETILGVLQESSLEIREAIHSLLSTSHVTSRSGLQNIVQSLLDNLRNYSSDRQSIWNCFKQLGLSHAPLVSILAPELLSIHPYYMSKEPDINDPAYISILILVFNAASATPTLTPLFPSHVFRHHQCLRDSLPHMVPPINAWKESSVLPRQPSSVTLSTASEVYLKQLLSRALNYLSGSHDPTVTMATLKQCSDDLTKLSGVEPSLKGCGLFSAQFLRCQLLINKICHSLSHTVLVSNGASEVSSNVRELTLLSYKLQYGFVNHTPLLIFLLSWLRFYGHCALVQLTMRLDWSTEHSNKYMRLEEGLVKRIENLKRLSCDIHMTSFSSVRAMFDKDLVAMGTDQLMYLLQNVTTSSTSVISHLKISDLLTIQQCDASVEELDHIPKDTPLKFLSSLAFSLPITATLNNIHDTSTVAIEVKFPDGLLLSFIPKPTEIHPLALTSHKLTHNLILSHGKWTDALKIQISLVIHHPTDISQEDKYIKLLDKLLKKGEEGRVTSSSNKVGVVLISSITDLKVQPQDTLARGFNVFGPT